MVGLMGGGREREQWETTPNNAVVVWEDKDLDDDKDTPFLLPIVVGGGGGGEGEGGKGGGQLRPPRGGRWGHCLPPPRPLPLHPSPPRARRRRAWQGSAVVPVAHLRGSRPVFPGPSRGGGQPAAAAASATVPRCRRPPGAAPSPLPRRLDGPTVTTVITAPMLRPAATPATVNPSGTTTPPPRPSPVKRTTRDRRTMTAAVTTGTTTRTATSGGGARSSTRPPPRRHRLSATSSATPLPRPACCCRASRCPGSTSNTATP
jgi:hypothetical protein